ncbi:unnamed protein product [Chrysoparadoxa australica]
MRFMFLGAPGAGKGTFASIISARLGLHLLGAGDMVRAEVQSGSALGTTFQNYSKAGELVPDELIDDIVRKRLGSLEKEGSKGFILEGYPRTTKQALELDKITQLDKVLNIALPEWVCQKKMLGRRHCLTCGRSFNVASVMSEGFDMPAILPEGLGCKSTADCIKSLVKREDDTPAIIQRRLDLYAAQAAPILAHYEAQGMSNQEHIAATWAPNRLAAWLAQYRNSTSHGPLTHSLLSPFVICYGKCFDEW